MCCSTTKDGGPVSGHGARTPQSVAWKERIHAEYNGLAALCNAEMQAASALASLRRNSRLLWIQVRSRRTLFGVRLDIAPHGALEQHDFLRKQCQRRIFIIGDVQQDPVPRVTLAIVFFLDE
jgi:hypothetical protein